MIVNRPAAGGKGRRLRRAARSRFHQARLRASRLVVCLSGKHTYAQVVSPEARVVVCASTVEKSLRPQFGKNGGNVAAAKAVGELLAQKAKAAGVGKLAFDRGGRAFDGRVKALAEAARAGGMQF